MGCYGLCAKVVQHVAYSFGVTIRRRHPYGREREAVSLKWLNLVLLETP